MKGSPLVAARHAPRLSLNMVLMAVLIAIPAVIVGWWAATALDSVLLGFMAAAMTGLIIIAAFGTALRPERGSGW